MPIISRGAVSPSAWAMPIMVPVRMPGRASGRTWCATVCSLRGTDAQGRLPDRGRHGAQGGTGRDDDRRQDQQRQRHAADQGRGARQAEGVEEDREAQEAEDDRGHGRQVVDVDLDHVGDPVLGRELLEIDRGRDADRHAQDDRHQHHVGRADESTADAGQLGLARVAAGEEERVERSVEPALRLRAGRAMPSAGSLSRRSASGASRSTRPFPNWSTSSSASSQTSTRLADQRGVGQHHVAQLVAAALVLTRPRSRRRSCRPVASGKSASSASLTRLAIVGPRQGGRVAVPCGSISAGRR